MSGIVPVPTTRVGDYFVRERLIEQIQSDQLDLFRLQYQVSTGQRIQLPSEDIAAALRAVNVQRLLDRKGQIQTNVQTSQSHLTAVESSIALISGELSDLRGGVLSVASTTATDEQRQTVVQQLDQLLEFLVNTGNTQTQGRYLFGGSQSQVQPYDYNGTFVQCDGNEADLRSYVDLAQLFETTIPGTEVFGGISAAVQGTADLDPHLTSNTRLSSLNGGAGVSRNAAVRIMVDNGGVTSASTIDLSSATTIGDVARLIEAQPPGEATITVDVTGTGLVIRTDTGTVRVDEVAQSQTAHELGIYTGSSGVASDVIVGSELDPVVTKTTALASLLGKKAQGRIESAGANNDLLLTAAQNGDSLNDVTVRFESGGTAGSETVTYDDFTKTLTVQVEAGFSTANQVAAAITAEGTFTAQSDYHDALLVSQAGSNPVDVADFGVITSGGSGEALDTASGLVLTNGGDPVVLDISNAVTVEDLLNLINDADLGLLADINDQQNGINVRSRLSGADMTIGENGGTTASQLGIRSYTETTRLADFNRGVGVPTSETGDDVIIVARNGTELSIDLEDAETVQDVIIAINNATGNNVGGTAVLARLATSGNGIELVDASTVTVNDLTVRVVEGSQAAQYLGFVPQDQTEVSSSTTDGSGNYVMTSEDRHTLEVDSVFNTLLRLRTALENGDVPEISRSLDRLDDDAQRVLYVRADIGGRLQNLDVIQTRLEDEDVELRKALSSDLDVDLVEAISNLTARQVAMQASLQSTASLLQLSLLNYI
jgi:flagellar hook-associated protein 3 FlgL